MTNLVTIMKAISSLAAIVDAMRPNLATIYAQYMYHRFLGVVLESTKRRIIAPLEALQAECQTSVQPYLLQLSGKSYDDACRFESEYYTVFLYNCPELGHRARIYAKALPGKCIDVRLYSTERVVNTAKDYNLPNLAECYSLFCQLLPKED